MAAEVEMDPAVEVRPGSMAPYVLWLLGAAALLQVPAISLLRFLLPPTALWTTQAGLVLGVVAGVAGVLHHRGWLSVSGTLATATTILWAGSLFVVGGLVHDLPGPTLLVTALFYGPGPVLSALAAVLAFGALLPERWGPPTPLDPDLPRPPEDLPHYAAAAGLTLAAFVQIGQTLALHALFGDKLMIALLGLPLSAAIGLPAVLLVPLGIAVALRHRWAASLGVVLPAATALPCMMMVTFLSTIPNLTGVISGPSWDFLLLQTGVITASLSAGLVCAWSLRALSPGGRPRTHGPG